MLGLGLGTLGTIGLTNLFGSNGFNSTAQWGLKPGDNVGGNFGHSLNLWTGQTDSANLQYKHNLELQHDAQNFTKWQMQNAHQSEVQDLQNAGLNPVLSANGGASAGVSANSTGAGTGGQDPIGMLGAIIGMINSTKTTKALVDKTEAETNNINTETDKTKQAIEWTPQLNRALIGLQNATSGKQYSSAQKDFQDIIESQVRTKGLEIMNRMSGMDLTKREKYFETEMALLKYQMEAELIEAGYQTDTVYRAIDKAFTMFGKLGHFGVNAGFNHSNSNVNIKSNGPKIYTHTASTPEIPIIY